MTEKEKKRREKCCSPKSQFVSFRCTCRGCKMVNRRELLLTVVLTFYLWSVTSAALPTFTIGRCPNPVPPASSDLWNKMRSTFNDPFVLASGSGAPNEPSIVYGCFSENHVHFKIVTEDSNPNSTFTQCNQPLYKMDAMEAFLGFFSFDDEYDLHHYLELEVSPLGVLFYAKIENPNLNCSNIAGNLQQCAGSGLTWMAGTSGPTWWSYLQVPFSALGASGGASMLASKPYKWRGNFFRIDLQTDGRQFSCWSPTFSNPACFHKPEYFGNLVLDFSPVL